MARMIGRRGIDGDADGGASSSARRRTRRPRRSASWTADHAAARRQPARRQRARRRRGRRRRSSALAGRTATRSERSAVVVPDAERPDQRQVALAGHPAQRHLGAAPPDRRPGRRPRRRARRRRWRRAVRAAAPATAGTAGRCRTATTPARIDRVERRHSLGRSGGRVPVDGRRCGSLDVGRRRTRRPPSPTGRYVAGAVRRLEHDRLAGAEAQHRPPGVASRERRRRRRCRRCRRRRRVLQPQGDAQVGVGPDLVADDAGRPLRGQHEVDAEAAAALGDADERREEAGQLGRQRGELVDHDDEPRQRRASPATERYASRSSTPAARSSRSRRRSLGLEADQGPLGEAVVEVGDDADGVRQVGAGVERRPALVVDEHERQVVRAAAQPPGQRRACAAARSCPRRSCRRSRACGPSATRSISTTPSAVGADRGTGPAAAIRRRSAVHCAMRRRWRSRRRSTWPPLRASTADSATDGGHAPAASAGSSGSWSPASRRAAPSATAIDSPAACTCARPRRRPRRRSSRPAHEAADAQLAAAQRRHGAAGRHDGDDGDRRRRGEVAAQRHRCAPTARRDGR